MVAVLAACTGDNSASSERFVAGSALDSLPALSIAEGRLVCTATGADGCPLSSAVANRFDDGRVAVWEPGSEVRILDAKNPSGRAFGVSGQGTGQYAVALAVGPYQGGIAIVDGQRNRLLHYDDAGNFKREDVLPTPTPNAAPGFVGDTPVLQTLQAPSDSAVAHLKVELLTSQEERTGVTVLDVPVPWLRLRGDSAVSFTPFFPTSPVYSIDRDQTVVWAPGDSFRVERRGFKGAVKWTLVSDRQGLPVTERDIEIRRDLIYRTAARGQLRPGELDSMVAATASMHPVISGIVLESRGRVLVAGSIAPSRDSVEYLLLSNAGEPANRLTLPMRTHPLILSGDSLLVHRPTEGEPWELRWLILKSRP